MGRLPFPRPTPDFISPDDFSARFDQAGFNLSYASSSPALGGDDPACSKATVGPGPGMTGTRFRISLRFRQKSRPTVVLRDSPGWFPVSTTKPGLNHLLLSGLEAGFGLQLLFAVCRWRSCCIG
jgi:hypothetical protein